MESTNKSDTSKVNWFFIGILSNWLILKPKKDKLLDAEEEDELKDIELDETDFEDKK